MPRKNEASQLKKRYQNLQERYDEACDVIQHLMDEQNRTDEEIRYLHEFISYKHLDSEFWYFRENAHEVQDPELPFSSLVL